MVTLPHLNGIGRVLGVLEGAAGDRDLCHAAVGTVEQHVGGGRAALGHVGFDVAAGDVNVANVATPHDHPAGAAVADVAGGDVRLVQIDMIVENAAAAVFINVATVDQDVAIPLDEMHAVAALADVNATERELKCAVGFDAVGFGMIAGDGEPLDDGHSLAFPHFRPDGFGGGAAGVRADKPNRRTGARHDHSSAAVRHNRGKTDLVELDDQRLGDPISACRKADGTNLGVN